MKNNENLIKYDVAIIGAGPAGLTCAIYVARGNLNVCFIDKGAPGGKMNLTYEIENWSGDENVKGYELSLRMLNHAKKQGAKHIFGNVVKIDSKNEFEHYVYFEDGKIIQAKTIVIATGMNNKIPEIPKIKEYENKGVSYCVVCDGPFYKNQPAAIIGGGDSAFEESIYLSSIASEIHIFVRKDKPKAEKGLVDKVSKIKNIKVHFNSEVKELIGEEKLEKIIYETKNEGLKELKVKILYPYIGYVSSNDFAKHFDIFDQDGFIITNDEMETKIPGIFAIGDIRQKRVRQIVTAASDGSIAGKNITNKINDK